MKATQPMTSKFCVLSSLLLALSLSHINVHAAASAPGGLYLGYYQEDALTNPEDPMPGAFVLELPKTDADFNGSMYFTYIGCQSSNVGTVMGKKSGFKLEGTWSGTVDNTAQTGPYSGSYDPKTSSYKGVYSNAGGKQFINVKNCAKYYIAPKGTWEMLPVENNQPANFQIDLNGARASWNSFPKASLQLVYIVDPKIALSGTGNPVLMQTILQASNKSLDLKALHLKTGDEYIIAVLINDSHGFKIGFASKRFVAP